MDAPKRKSQVSKLGQIRSYTYWTFMEVLVRLLGASYWEQKWRRRGAEDVKKGFSNITHPHRPWLMEQFDALYPFSSVLEIGCGYGPNVSLLAMRFPDIEVLGFDINAISVREGNAWLAERGIKRAHLIPGKADELSGFADGTIDVVFTDATLLYIGPDKINQVIAEMKRISRKALLFVELHRSDSRRDPGGLGLFTPDGWIRDYRKLLNHFFPDDSIALSKIPADIWPEGRWPDHGCLVTVMR